MEASSLMVLFLKYEMVEGHAEYIIQVSDQEQTWTIRCRYSKLADVHALLKGLNKKLPDFPPKKMFGSSNPSFISQRQAGLQHYTKTLLEGGAKYNIKPLIELLKSGSKLKITRKGCFYAQS
jgi:hypothetical protein